MGTPKQQDKIFTEEQPLMDKSLRKNIFLFFACAHLENLKILRFFFLA
jgi:hypothetical protein